MNFPCHIPRPYFARQLKPEPSLRTCIAFRDLNQKISQTLSAKCRKVIRVQCCLWCHAEILEHAAGEFLAPTGYQ